MPNRCDVKSAMRKTSCVDNVIDFFDDVLYGFNIFWQIRRFWEEAGIKVCFWYKCQESTSELLEFYMRHACDLKFGVSWSSVGEATKSIYMIQSDLENTVLLGKNRFSLQRNDRRKLQALICSMKIPFCLHCFFPNKRSEEGFLLGLYRITFVGQDFPSSSSCLSNVLSVWGPRAGIILL